ncbi:MAG TPA: Wzz/FepE/Etk N-terminal domain-containing protein, partial [Candidatus Caenarcaniphilales bacterium]
MESTQYLEIQQYWSTLKRRWLPATVALGSVVTLTALATFLQKPVYEAEGKLLFKKTSSTSSLTGLGESIGELSSLGTQSNPVDTEAEVVLSVPIVQKTIAQLELKDKQ